MQIKNLEFVDGMQGRAVVSFNKNELSTLCDGLCLLSKQKDYNYDKHLHTQIRVARDILSYGVVDSFTFNTAVESTTD